MTSNERKIINFLRDAKEKTRIRLIAKKTNFSSDYARSLCLSLSAAGYVKLEDSNICCLLEKSQGNFESMAVVAEASEPLVASANIIPLADELAVVSPASDQGDVVRQGSPQEEENQEEGASDDEDQYKPDKEVLIETGAVEEEKMEKSDETELKPEPKAEEVKETAPEAEMKTVTDTADGKEETKAENPEKVLLKEEPAKSSGGFGASFKKIVPIAKLSRILDKVGINWFAEKK